jgi:hypothetical protein
MAGGGYIPSHTITYEYVLHTTHIMVSSFYFPHGAERMHVAVGYISLFSS